VLDSKGIPVNKSSCPGGVRYQDVSGGCTSLGGISKAAVAGIVQFKEDCQCNVIVTGGTELGHKGSGPGTHAGGDKLDIGRSAAVDSYIQNNYTKIGIRSDGATMYKAPNGAVYAKESDHWDVKGWDACYGASC